MKNWNQINILFLFRMSLVFCLYHKIPFIPFYDICIALQRRRCPKTNRFSVKAKRGYISFIAQKSTVIHDFPPIH